MQLASRNEEMRINNCQRGRCTIDFDSETSCTQVQQVFENVMLMSSIVSCFIYIILLHQAIKDSNVAKNRRGGDGKATKS